MASPNDGRGIYRCPGHSQPSRKRESPNSVDSENQANGHIESDGSPKKMRPKRVAKAMAGTKKKTSTSFRTSRGRCRRMDKGVLESETRPPPPQQEVYGGGEGLLLGYAFHPLHPLAGKKGSWLMHGLFASPQGRKGPIGRYEHLRALQERICSDKVFALLDENPAQGESMRST